jgi:hypothetical protein
MERIRVFALVVFYAAPAAWLLVFGVLLAGTVLRIGHLPSYAAPDPKQIEGLGGFVLAARLLLVPVFVSPLMVGSDLLFLTLKGAPLRTRYRVLTAYLASLAVFAAIVFGNAFGLMNWLMD